MEGTWIRENSREILGGRIKVIDTWEVEFLEMGEGKRGKAPKHSPNPKFMQKHSVG